MLAVQQQSLDYFIPLRGFERSMLDDVRSILDADSSGKERSQLNTVDEAFNRWKWADKVKHAMRDDLEGKTLQTDYQGDRSKAYISFMQFLLWSKVPNEHLARANSITEANPDFVSRLGDQPMQCVQFRPLAQDIPFWETMAHILPICRPYLEQLKSLWNDRGTFEILRIVKVFMLLRKAPSNRGLVLSSLISNHVFQKVYSAGIKCFRETEDSSAAFPDFESYTEPMSTVSVAEMNDHQLSIVKRRTKKPWPKDEPILEENGQMTNAFIKYVLVDMGQSQELADPRYYVEFIDWNDLKGISEAELQHAGISTDIPFARQDKSTQWLTWTPPYKSLAWSHHFHTEDEVFEYNMLQWPLPDHYLDDQVIFHAREITRTDFIGNLEQFWEAWNDCAITQQDCEGPILLLESIPGMRFRNREKYQDQMSAIMYFRNLVEANASGTSDTSRLRELLGLEATYTPAFEHSLRLIPEEELPAVSWDVPLGKGANGVVYSAEWHRPRGLLATTNAADDVVQVVLKDVQSRANSSVKSREKLIKELDLTFASLGGGATGCINFLGVANLEKPGAGSDSTADTRIFLVFKRATQGDVLEFLTRHIKPMDFVTSWDTVVLALNSIGTGICTLHKHEVLHRDLHMNNILVTDRYIAHDFIHSHEYEYLISDVGEGKILRDGVEFERPFDNLASYGAIDFRAPEVHGGEGWTPKAEVFSFGVIVTKILQARRSACTAEPPSWVLESLKDTEAQTDEAELVPVILKKAIERCLQFSPDDRSTMGEIVHYLDNLPGEFVPKSSSDIENTRGSIDDAEDEVLPLEEVTSAKTLKVEWTYWDWRQTLQLAREPKKEADRALVVVKTIDGDLGKTRKRPTLR